MDEREEEYSRLFGHLQSVATQSDWYSSDGTTWDPDADWNKDAELIFASDDFAIMITSEIKEILSATPMPPREDFSKELLNLIERVESRGKNDQA